jgi:hypothetical protein
MSASDHSLALTRDPRRGEDSNVTGARETQFGNEAPGTAMVAVIASRAPWLTSADCPPQSKFWLDGLSGIAVLGVVHTVIETPRFLASAEEEGIEENERASFVAYIAEHPTAGVIIADTGGARKVRFAGRGKGKGGGYRVITYYARQDIPVFLIDIYGKGRRSDISMAEKKAIRKWAATLDQWSSR